jgi:ribosomal 50S subunit-recycling heat shock protein
MENLMRLDKYLKVSRIIKRRTLAKEVADAGRILINDKIAKSSSTVSIDDIIEIKYGNKIFVVKVIKLLDSTKKDDAKAMYEILEERRLSNDN